MFYNYFFIEFIIIFYQNDYVVSSSITISTRAYEDASNDKSELTMYELVSEVCDKPEDLESCSRKTGHLANAIASKKVASPRSRPPPPPSKSNLSNNMEVIKPAEGENKEGSHVDDIFPRNNRRNGKCDLQNFRNLFCKRMFYRFFIIFLISSQCFLKILSKKIGKTYYNRHTYEIKAAMVEIYVTSKNS